MLQFMSRQETNAPDLIELLPAAAEQQPVLANLLELYAHDFSEFLEIELGEDGRFGYEPLPQYWLDPNRHPFLVRVKGNLAGFVLVKKGSVFSDDPDLWDVAEFFVARRYRRRGIGSEIANAVWRRFPGRWEVRVMESNHSARQFWERAISEYIGEQVRPVRIPKDGKNWWVFSFASKPPLDLRDAAR